MTQQRTRGSEVTAQVIVGGNLLGGSWAKVLEWSITPRQSVTETGFQDGELEDELDFAHMGYDFDMQFQEIGPDLRDLLFTFVGQETNRAAYPEVQISLTIKARGGQAPVETLIFENVVFKFDSIKGSSKKDFIATTISGKFKILSRL